MENNNQNKNTEKNEEITTNKEAINENIEMSNQKKSKNIEIVFGINNKKFYISKEFNQLKKLEKIFVLSNMLQNLENILLYAKDIVLEQILKPNISIGFYNKAKNDDNFYKELITYLVDSNFLEVSKDMLTPFYYKIKIFNYPEESSQLIKKDILENIKVEITDSIIELDLPDEEKEINLINIITIFLILLKQYITIFDSLNEEELKIITEEEKVLNS